MCIKIIQHYYIMQKFNGGNPVHICDGCRTMFRPGDPVYELCAECAQVVWCVTNVFDDGSKELSSVHRTRKKAEEWIESLKDITDKINKETERRLIRKEVTSWMVL